MRSCYTTAVFVAFALIACGDADIQEPEAQKQEPVPVARWACYDPVDPHCINDPPDGDLYEEMPGVYLGSSFSADKCLGYYINDSDRDGLDDFCEYQLALTFRPALAFHPEEADASREPYFAARKTGTRSVKIMYLFAYHQDNGNSFAFACSGWPFIYPHCAPHAGDSEFVTIDIEFHTTWKHWIVTRAFLSAHYGTSGDSSADAHFDALLYPEKYRWYPLIFVARDKHANYVDPWYCEDGSSGTDTCEGNTVQGRLDVLEYRNVGSSTVAFVDSTKSVKPTLYPGTEYFWSNYRFCGWNYSASNCATSYSSQLRAFGF